MEEALPPARHDLDLKPSGKVFLVTFSQMSWDWDDKWVAMREDFTAFQDVTSKLCKCIIQLRKNYAPLFRYWSSFGSCSLWQKESSVSRKRWEKATSEICSKKHQRTMSVSWSSSWDLVSNGSASHHYKWDRSSKSRISTKKAIASSEDLDSAVGASSLRDMVHLTLNPIIINSHTNGLNRSTGQLRTSIWILQFMADSLSAIWNSLLRGRLWSTQLRRLYKWNPPLPRMISSLTGNHWPLHNPNIQNLNFHLSKHISNIRCPLLSLHGLSLVLQIHHNCLTFLNLLCFYYCAQAGRVVEFLPARLWWIRWKGCPTTGSPFLLNGKSHLWIGNRPSCHL